MAVSVERTQCFSYTSFFCFVSEFPLYRLSMSRFESEIEQKKTELKGVGVGETG